MDAYQIDIRRPYRAVLAVCRFTRATSADVATILGPLPVSRVQFFANAVNTRTRGIDVVAQRAHCAGPRQPPAAHGSRQLQPHRGTELQLLVVHHRQ
ncbi:MAG: hypothetical protein WKG07_27005 [Hymenobacter sp.]